MSQFDQSTEKLAGEHADKYCGKISEQQNQLGTMMRNAAVKDFSEGRNSAKETLEILARALVEGVAKCELLLLAASDFVEKQKRDDTELFMRDLREKSAQIKHCIAAVKAQGNWPLEERP